MPFSPYPSTQQILNRKLLGLLSLKQNLWPVLVDRISTTVNWDYIQRVVIGTPTQVDTLSAQFRVEAFLKGQPSAETLSLITAPADEGRQLLFPPHGPLCRRPEVSVDAA